MATFPAAPAPVYPCVVNPIWKTLVSDYEGGGEQRRQKWLYAKYDVKLNYNALSEADAEILWAFYMARKGAYDSFYFYDLYAFDHVGLYIATADGVIDTFDIPGKSTSSRTLYEDSSVISSGFSYLTGGGDSDADRVEYTAAPAVGTIITIDFTGYLRIKCRFKEDQLSRENFITTLFKYGLELKGI